MISLLLYLLFGIGQPSNSQSNAGSSIIQSMNIDGEDPDNGGENGTVRPPKN